MNKFEQLPDDCLAQILSLTSPLDVCTSMLLSRAIYNVASSDVLWEIFLPPDYREIVSRLVNPMLFTSKKELFMRMCSPLQIDGGTKHKNTSEEKTLVKRASRLSSKAPLPYSSIQAFSIERETSKKCYKLGVRELSIPWSSSALYWYWKPSIESSMGEIAELITISWLEINGKMSTQMLSPNTYYGAYIIVKFADHAYGLDSLPTELLVEIGDYKSQGTVYLRPYEQEKYSKNAVWTHHWSEALMSRVIAGEQYALRERKDGWWEIEMGEFYCDGSDKEVKMSLKEIMGGHLKGGLIVESIDLRPKS